MASALGPLALRSTEARAEALDLTQVGVYPHDQLARPARICRALGGCSLRSDGRFGEGTESSLHHEQAPASSEVKIELNFRLDFLGLSVRDGTYF